MEKNKILTPLELKVMNLIWALKKAFVKDLINNWKEAKKPAYNTISTTIRILEDKGFIAHKAFGRTYEYFPKISKTNYQKNFLAAALKNVFSGSANNLISTLLDSEKLSKQQIEDLETLISKTK